MSGPATPSSAGASLTLTEIAARIHAHLKRFEADPKINVRDEHQTQPYYYAGASRAGNRVAISYVSYQHTWKITRGEALAYLEWLDAGNVGKHFAMQMQQQRGYEDDDSTGLAGHPDGPGERW